MPILELEDKNNPLVIVQKDNNSISYNQRGAETEAVVNIHSYSLSAHPNLSFPLKSVHILRSKLNLPIETQK